ncbi:MAG: hypothetical protein ACREBU_12200 [Nitrososphaera sp.]
MGDRLPAMAARARRKVAELINQGMIDAGSQDVEFAATCLE